MTRLHKHRQSLRWLSMPTSHALHTHTHPFKGPLSRTTLVSRYQKGKTNLDFTEARDSEWQWHQLGHMQVCTSLQTDNHANTSPLSFLQAGCPSCRPVNSVKALKATCFTKLENPASLMENNHGVEYLRLFIATKVTSDCSVNGHRAKQSH